MARSVIASFDPEDGRVEVLTPDGFTAIRVDGVWEAGRRFQLSDINDNFFSVRDEVLANELLKEAKIALNITSSNKPFMDVQSLYQTAIKFAADKHKEQKVPGTELPYVVHLSNAAMEIFMAAIHTPDFNLNLAIPTALLHDAIEDTNTTADEIEALFGTTVTESVLALTKNKNLPNDQSMSDSLERIKQQPKEVWAVKLADRITNLQQPPAHWNNDKKKEYLEEAGAIYEALKDGNEYLANRLRIKTQEYERYI